MIVVVPAGCGCWSWFGRAVMMVVVLRRPRARGWQVGVRHDAGAQTRWRSRESSGGS